MGIIIGLQEWDYANLNVNTYANGEAIPQVTDAATWAALTTGARCSVDNNSANDAIYGQLYNWYAVSDSRGLAPSGWNIPTLADFNTLKTYLTGHATFWCNGNSNNVGKSLASTNLWLAETVECSPGYLPALNNSTGFAAKPAGWRGNTGAFSLAGNRGVFWSRSEALNPIQGDYMSIIGNTPLLSITAFAKFAGMSVRCFKSYTPVVSNNKISMII